MEIISTSTDNFLFFFYTISTLFFLNHINISNVICIQVFLDMGNTGVINGVRQQCL